MCAEGGAAGADKPRRGEANESRKSRKKKSWNGRMEGPRRSTRREQTGEAGQHVDHQGARRQREREILQERKVGQERDVDCISGR